MLLGSVRDVEPITLRPVRSLEDRQLFRELVGRYHYLGHAVPFGAQQRYLVQVARPRPTVVGCLQFSSPAWRMAARDRWIGWDDATRRRQLQHVVNNSRFLILPWVRVKNLASAVLARGVRQLAADWPARYAVAPYLVETLVDSRRYTGSCYRAANWIVVGETTGRGRMDRQHRRAGEAPEVGPALSSGRGRRPAAARGLSGAGGQGSPGEARRGVHESRRTLCGDEAVSGFARGRRDERE